MSGGGPSDIEKHKDSELRISDEVIASIAGIAASQVPGVVSLTGNIVGDISAILAEEPCQGSGIFRRTRCYS